MQEDLPASDLHVFHPHVSTQNSVASALVAQLAELGIEEAFGVIGGAIGVLFDALEDSPIQIRHFRHESGAAFAAAEAHFASGKPTAVFSTTGPGILNALTGLTAARWEGAKVIALSGTTSAAQRGRWATQETSAYTIPQDSLYGPGALFDYATRIEHGAELPEVLRRLGNGISRPGGFVAHVGLPIGLQASVVDVPHKRSTVSISSPSISAEDAGRFVAAFAEAPFAIWVGFGARHAAPQIRSLAERTGAHVLCSPRAKGVFPEGHPLFVGVTGLGGHESAAEYMQQMQPAWTLVLGTRLGEATSFWDPDLLPTKGFVHVDIDPTVPGVAYPEVYTEGVQADIGLFLDALLEQLTVSQINRGRSLKAVPSYRSPSWRPAADPLERHTDTPTGLVRPQALMRAIQDRVVDRSSAVVMAESGNAFAWCNHYLRFDAPGRYRVSTLFGSMGHCAAGVVGAALARHGKAVAVVGDGSMLMNCEISTAVQYQVPAVWVVLNDAGYGMCESGQSVLGLASGQLSIPKVDFVALARAVGADGVHVRDEAALEAALDTALAAETPFVVDIAIDPSESSPLMERFESLLRQGSSKTVAGWDN